MNDNFIFYDTETSGRDPNFDQIFQFAAILTDSELRIIDQFEIRSKRLPQIVPSPGALLVTGLIPETLDQAPFSNYEFAGVISRKLNEWAPAVVSGYNIFSFDERFLRSLFYQNLYPVYQTQSLGNTRLDILPLVQACEAIAARSLTFPLNEKGKTSKKLEHIAKANGFENHNAHDALGDVEATIHVAKLIKSNAPKLWEVALRGRSRRHFKESIVDGSWRVFQDNNYGWPITYPGLPVVEINNGRDWLCVDLRKPVPEPSKIYDEASFKGRDRIFRQLKCAEVPLAFTFEEAADFDAPFLIDVDQINLNSQSWQEIIDRSKLLEAFEISRPEFLDSEHPEQQIYQRFEAFNENRWLMENFHDADVDQKIVLSNQFSDARFRLFAKRILYDNYVQYLGPDTIQKTKQAIKDRISGNDDVPWQTVNKALVELEALRNEGNRNAGHLDLIEKFLKNIAMN